MTSYDDWKTDAPDPEDFEECGCVWVFNNGIRFLVERCAEHEALYLEEEARQEAHRTLQKLTEKEDDDTGDDFPF